MTRSYINCGSISITPGVNQGFCEKTWELYGVIETLTASDAVKAKIRGVKYSIRLYSDTLSGFTIIPIVVQTDGNFADTYNLSSRLIDSLVDNSVDDVCGYDKLGDIRTSRVIPGDGTLAGLFQGIEITVQLSPKHIQILTKENETERLQNLYLGFAGVSVANINIGGHSWLQIDYTVERKEVVLR